MIRIYTHCLAVAAFALFLVTHATLAGAQSQLTVYGAFEPDESKKWADRFNKDHPNIKLNMIRSSTGTMTARILAEKSNPQADVIWRLANTSLIIFDQQGMLEAYKPKGYDKVDARFRDKKDPPMWVGHMAYMAAVCFNTVEGAKHKLPKPESWKDFAKPAYKGHLVMPNPGSSGTGFLDVSSWIQLFGEADAWTLMDGIHANISQYTHSGSKPCAMAASGEVPIGISWDMRAIALKNKGAPIDVIFPKEGLGWDLEGSAILKGTKNLNAAKTFMDWIVSPAAMELYNESYALIGTPASAKPLPNYPTDVNQRLIKNDFWWAASNRERLLTEWLKRYDAKSEPKPK